jgi:RHS repeat-associated protein
LSRNDATVFTNYFAYGPFGGLVDRMNESWTYDKRGRVSTYQALDNANPSILQYGYTLSYNPNSTLRSSTETVGSSSWTWQNTYDTLNRLSTSASSALSQGCIESYDSFGNRTSQAAYGGSGYSCFDAVPFSFNSGNQIMGYCYDASGNLLDEGACPASGVHMFTYDAENRISSAQYGAVTYVYGADGVRATKNTSSESMNYVYDYDGSLTAHLLWANGSVTYAGQQQEIWLNGTHYGYAIDPGGTFNYAYVDWLGSERVVANASGDVVGAYRSLPFGDGWTQFLTGWDNDLTGFTGKERDSESGNDYFGARYYGSSMGRFLTPDPSGLAYANLNNPQSLNLYAYGLNNPLKFIDPSGLDDCDPTEGGYDCSGDGDGNGDGNGNSDGSDGSQGFGYSDGPNAQSGANDNPTIFKAYAYAFNLNLFLFYVPLSSFSGPGWLLYGPLANGPVHSAPGNTGGGAPNKPSYTKQILTQPPPCGGGYGQPCTFTPPSCSALQDTGIVVGVLGTGMRAYAGLAALVPGLGLPVAAGVGSAGSLVSLVGVVAGAAGHFHFGCTP